MKKLLFILIVPVFALAQSTNQNYVKTTIYKGAGATNPSSQVTYFDGLGRPIQKVDNAQSNTGKDIVTHMEYDPFGRQPKQFLPYPSAVSDMLYIDGATASTATTTHYQTAYNDTNPYSEQLLEASPLNRVLEQAAPGAAWGLSAATKHTVRLDYQSNNANEVKLFVATATWNSTSELYDISIASTVDYAANELYKTITKDENWTSGTNNTTEEFKDKEGRVVLKRTYGTSMKNGAPVNEKHDTYYVYDQYGNLTYVIPPLADGAFDTNTLNGLCYQYKYDYRNRLVEKKLPGKQWEFIVYDKLDRVVATGPALSPFSDLTGNGWLITKYDVFNRPVLTAWEQATVDSGARKTKQNGCNLATSNSESKTTSPTTVNGVSFNYTNTINPTSYHVLTVNYYDDYLFPHAGPIPTTVLDQPVYYNNTQKPTGLPSGSWVRALETTTTYNAEKNITYYDYKARPIRTKKVNYLGGYTQVDSNLDFIGKTIYTETRHKRLTNNTELLIREDFTYSAQDRLLTHTHQINGGTKQLLASNVYDELGQLITKKVGGADITGAAGLQKVDYKYNIRGWLKDINNVDNLTDGINPQDLFAFKLNYNDNVTSGLPANQTAVAQLFNGNISETFWRTSSDNKTRKYGFQYDNLNRLTDAVFQEPTASVVTNSYNESLSYDKNGNITSLNRKGYLALAPFNTTIDNLTYTYGTVNKNELRKVVDTSTNTSGFKDGTNTGDDYNYDANGNVVIDSNKSINGCTYNHLNLPIRTTFGIYGQITYLYNAMGQKITKTVRPQGASNLITNYLDGFQYVSAVLQFFPHAEGYVKRETTGAYTYVFNHTDHLGNVRLSYSDLNKDNSLTANEILEENNYYPFGLKHANYNTNNTQPGYKYKYNGKEFQDELGLNMYDYGARNYDPAIGRWMNVDPLTEVNPHKNPYNYCSNNPISRTDPTGMLDGDSTHTDKDGNVVAVYNDGDLGVYKHDGNKAQATKSVEANYSSTNTSAGGKRMGDSLTPLGFADFNAYGKDGTVKAAQGAKIDFNSTWATDKVSEILGANPTLAGYALKARGGHEWDIKSDTPNGNIYYGSNLFGSYASARDAGNFAAGAVAQMSLMPNGFSDYGFGTYNASGNSVWGSIKSVASDLMTYGTNPALGASLMSIKANFGEHPLSRTGIEAGKSFGKLLQKR